MRDNHFTKSLAILLNLTLVGSSFADVGMPGSSAAVAMPDFVKALTPPSQLGYITDSYQGQTDKPVVLIQDLHANYGVQQKIEGLLQFLEPKVSPNGQPMVLGIEGAWGKLDLAEIRSVAEKARRAASDFLLKEAEISGMEHFVALNPQPVNFYGIDNPQDYLIHVNLFRKSLAARLHLAEKVDRLRQSVNQSKVDGPRALRHIWKLSDDFHAGKIGLDELSRALKTPLSNYGEAEAALANAQSAVAEQQPGDKALYMKNLVEADQDLELLARLFRQQLTLEEVQFVSQRVPKMLVVIQALIPGENMKLWEDTVRSAIDHYAVALLRNKPMSAHAQDLVQQYPGQSVVIVTGGFHTAGIMEALKAKQMSYVVIAPDVEAQTDRDEKIYLKRMMGIHVTEPEVATAVHAFASAKTVPDQTLYVAEPEVKERLATQEIVKDANLEREVVSDFANGAPEKDVANRLFNVQSPEQVAAGTVIDKQAVPEAPAVSPNLLQRIAARIARAVGIRQSGNPVAPETTAETTSSFTFGRAVAAVRSLGTRTVVKATGVVATISTFVGSGFSQTIPSSEGTLKAVNVAAQTGHQFAAAHSSALPSGALAVALNTGHSMMTTMAAGFSTSFHAHPGAWVAGLIGAGAVTAASLPAVRRALNGAA